MNEIIMAVEYDYEPLIEAVEDLLLSGDDAGCDNLIVVDKKAFDKLQRVYNETP